MRRKILIIGSTFAMLLMIIGSQLFYGQRVEANISRIQDLKQRSKIVSQEEIADQLIRFHVLANSDSDKDQEIKIQVRDAVLKEVVPYLEKSRNLEETRGIIEKKKDTMIKIAEEVLQENNKEYGVTANLGKVSFPTKYYGEFSLPAGDYEAFRIVLGKGRGANWWCVMFPPLCFIHIEEEQPGEDTREIENLIEPAATLEEETPGDLLIEEEEEPIEVRWKIIEIFQAIF